MRLVVLLLYAVCIYCYWVVGYRLSVSIWESRVGWWWRDGVPIWFCTVLFLRQARYEVLRRYGTS